MSPARTPSSTSWLLYAIGVGEVGELRLETRLGAIQKSLAYIAELARILGGAVLQDPFPALESKIETGEFGIPFLELVDYA